MPLTRLRKRDTLLNILRHLIIRFHLARNQLNRLLRQPLRQTHNAVQIRDQEVPRIDRRILIFAVETHRCIDGADARDFLWCGGADVAGEDLQDQPKYIEHERKKKRSYRILQIPMLLQIPQSTINNRPDGSRVLRPRAHQAPIARIDHPRRGGNENHRARRNRINIVTLWLRFVFVVFANVLDGVSGPDDFGRTFLAMGGPHGEAGEEAAVRDFELCEGVGDVAAGRCGQQRESWILSKM